MVPCSEELESEVTRLTLREALCITRVNCKTEIFDLKLVDQMKLFAAILSTFLMTNSASAFDLNDCIINGMKGVSSDVAARQVRYACDQKERAYIAERRLKFEQEFGEALGSELLELASSFEFAGPGKHSIQVTSKESSKAVTLIRLEVAPAPGGAGTTCDRAKSRVFAYKVMLKPAQRVKLVYPSAGDSNCVSVASANSRLAKWTDIAFSSTADPMPKDPLEEPK